MGWVEHEVDHCSKGGETTLRMFLEAGTPMRPAPSRSDLELIKAGQSSQIIASIRNGPRRRRALAKRSENC